MTSSRHSDAGRDPSRIASRTGILRNKERGACVASMCVVLSLAGSNAEAFTIEHSAARYGDKRYECELTVILDAPRERVEAVLRDYERYPALDSRILDARVLERPEDNIALLATTLRACFGWFCRNVHRIERVEESEEGLVAITDGDRSDVRFGETRTTLETLEEGTRVTYRTSITPGFWVPPLGRRWMLNTLTEATRQLFQNVEERARAEDSSLGAEESGMHQAEKDGPARPRE